MAMRVSAVAEKLLMIEEELEILTEFQVEVGLGFCLRGSAALVDEG